MKNLILFTFILLLFNCKETNAQLKERNKKENISNKQNKIDIDKKVKCIFYFNYSKIFSFVYY